MEIRQFGSLPALCGVDLSGTHQRSKIYGERALSG